MTIIDKIQELPGRVRSAAEAFIAPAPLKQDLNDLAEKGAKVVQMMGTPGHQIVQAERDAQIDILLGRFLGPEVMSWEKFLELRGFGNGMLAGNNIEGQLLNAGIQAEKALTKSRGKGSE